MQQGQRSINFLLHENARDDEEYAELTQIFSELAAGLGTTSRVQALGLVDDDYVVPAFLLDEMLGSPVAPFTLFCALGSLVK